MKINKIDNSQTINKTNRAKSWFCEKFNKNNKPFTRFVKKKKKERENTNYQYQEQRMEVNKDSQILKKLKGSIMEQSMPINSPT